MTADNTADRHQSNLVRSYTVLTDIHLNISSKYVNRKNTSMTADNTADRDQSNLVRSYTVLTDIHLNISSKYGTPIYLLKTLQVTIKTAWSRSTLFSQIFSRNINNNTDTFITAARDQSSLVSRFSVLTNIQNKYGNKKRCS